MSGYITVMGPCWSCHRIMSFSPTRVPSIMVAGRREAICRDCVDRANELRRGNGLDLIVPLPDAWGADDA